MKRRRRRRSERIFGRYYRSISFCERRIRSERRPFSENRSQEKWNNRRNGKEDSSRKTRKYGARKKRKTVLGRNRLKETDRLFLRQGSSRRYLSKGSDESFRRNGRRSFSENRSRKRSFSGKSFPGKCNNRRRKKKIILGREEIVRRNRTNLSGTEEDEATEDTEKTIVPERKGQERSFPENEIRGETEE